MGLKEWKKKQLKRHKIKKFYHLTSIRNIFSIMVNGLCPLNKVREMGIQHQDISDQDVQSIRSWKSLEVSPSVEKQIHDLVPMFFWVQNPMVYRVCRESDANDLCFLAINSEILAEDNISFAMCDGNAASINTESWFYFGKGGKNLDRIPKDDLKQGKWEKNDDEMKRKLQAEVLVFPKVPSEMISHIICATEMAKKNTEKVLQEAGSITEVNVQPNLFYLQ